MSIGKLKTRLNLEKKLFLYNKFWGNLRMVGKVVVVDKPVKLP